ncbi:hypothetical protein AMTR_s00001p00272510 [Amborella trichopoda]|uniref:Uncharacterized protein n=1 Tax=Amborella trichopoda TaxID=13333 RepID=W1NMG3_AMBTC|nr:hypothetical protein AMTR_s00001p00272510 [Amborella trichopoda]
MTRPSVNVKNSARLSMNVDSEGVRHSSAPQGTPSSTADLLFPNPGIEDGSRQVGFATHFTERVMMKGCDVGGTSVGSLNQLGGGPSFPKLSTFPKLQATSLKAVDEALQKLCWLLLTAIVVTVGHHLRSKVALQFVLVVLGKMYPLMHRRASRKGRPCQRSSVNPLKINPLAIGLVDEVQEQVVLEDGEYTPRVGVNGTFASSYGGC